MKKIIFIFLVLIISSCKSDCQKTNEKLMFTIDSLSNENLNNRIEIGRYEIIMERLVVSDSAMYDKITNNIE